MFDAKVSKTVDTVLVFLGWCSGCPEFRFVTGIKVNSRVTPWVYCCCLVDFGKVRSVRFLALFDAKVSKTVDTIVAFLGVLWGFWS